MDIKAHMLSTYPSLAFSRRRSLQGLSYHSICPGEHPTVERNIFNLDLVTDEKDEMHILYYFSVFISDANVACFSDNLAFRICR